MKDSVRCSLDQRRNEREVEHSQKEIIWRHQKRLEQYSPAIISGSPEIQNSMRLRLRVIYTKADGLVVYGKELEFKDKIKNKPDIADVVEKKLITEIRSDLICPKGYITARGKEKIKGEGHWLF